MAQEPVTGGTGLPEERSKLPIVQTEQQAGITDTPATLPTGTEVTPDKLEIGADELLTTPAPLTAKEQTIATSPTTNLDVSVPQSKQQQLIRHTQNREQLKLMPQVVH